MAKQISPAELYVVRHNAMRMKDGPPTLWEWLANGLEQEGPQAALNGLRRYGLPPRPATYHSMEWAVLDRLLHLLNDPTLDVNEPVSIPPVQGLAGSYSMTPLHGIVLDARHGAMVAWLLDHGADLKVTNDRGQTVGDLLDEYVARNKALKNRSMTHKVSKKLDRVNARAEQTSTDLRARMIADEQRQLRDTLDQESRTLMALPKAEPVRHRARL